MQELVGIADGHDPSLYLMRGFVSGRSRSQLVLSEPKPCDCLSEPSGVVVQGRTFRRSISAILLPPTVSIPYPASV
jgi:hypothetical protein